MISEEVEFYESDVDLNIEDAKREMTIIYQYPIQTDLLVVGYFGGGSRTNNEFGEISKFQVYLMILRGIELDVIDTKSCVIDIQKMKYASSSNMQLNFFLAICIVEVKLNYIRLRH